MNLSYSKSNRNYRGFSKYRKLNFCQVKIASALLAAKAKKVSNWKIIFNVKSIEKANLFALFASSIDLKMGSKRNSSNRSFMRRWARQFVSVLMIFVVKKWPFVLEVLQHLIESLGCTPQSKSAINDNKNKNLSSTNYLKVYD